MTGLNETIPERAEPGCATCQTRPEHAVYRSGAGFYVGRWCRCGPFSRDSVYYETREEAEQALASGIFSRS